MWEFLSKLLETLQNIDWKYIWTELQRIPTLLKTILYVAIGIWIIYFGYQKFVDINDITTIKNEVELLKERTNSIITEDDYKRDLHYIIEILHIIDEVQYYDFNEQQEQLRLVREFIKNNHPYDPILHDVDAMLRRNETQMKNARIEYNKILQKCDTKIVTDSLYLKKY